MSAAPSASAINSTSAANFDERAKALKTSGVMFGSNDWLDETVFQDFFCPLIIKIQTIFILSKVANFIVSF